MSESQNTTLLRHLKKRSIDTIEAFNLYGITRLAARVHDLRSDGFNIRTKIIAGKNRYDKPVTFARYYLN